ncbi:MAG: T9SS type A sorting domain-containing protein [Bacteroidetes bacterium]|nr:MAG: T9SS type A sorting domain-containing protein [Bacteroidota bacterium]
MKIKIFGLILSLFFISGKNAFGQQEFQITELTKTECTITDFHHSLNGGTILVGESQQAGTSFIELQKFLLDLSPEWAYSFSSTDSVIHARALTESNDRGYLTAAQIVQSGNLSDPESDILLFKTDEQGQLLWSKRIDHYYSDNPVSILNYTDATIYVTSRVTTTNISPHYSVSLLRCDSTGNVLWSKSINGSSNEIASNLIRTSDDQLAISGTSNSFSSGSSFFLSKLDTAGNYFWFRTYFTGPADTCHGLIQTNDGGYLLIGSGGLDGKDVLLIKTDQNGITQNSHSFNLGFGSNKNLDKGIRVLNTSDGGYAIAGESQQEGSDLPFFFIIKISQNLVIEWHDTYGFQLKNKFASILELTDEGFLLSGGRENFGTSITRNLLIKTDSAGNSSCLQTVVDLTDQNENPFSSSASPSTLSTVTTQTTIALTRGITSYVNDTACYLPTGLSEMSIQNSISVFPNPFRNKLNLDLGGYSIDEAVEIQITDQTGRILYRRENVKISSPAGIEIDLPDFRQGTYFLCLKNRGRMLQAKKIICSY